MCLFPREEEKHLPFPVHSVRGSKDSPEALFVVHWGSFVCTLEAGPCIKLWCGFQRGLHVCVCVCVYTIAFSNKDMGIKLALHLFRSNIQGFKQLWLKKHSKKVAFVLNTYRGSLLVVIPRAMQPDDYLHSICIVVGISNLEVIWRMQEDVHGLSADATPFQVGIRVEISVVICECCHSWGARTNPR